MGVPEKTLITGEEILEYIPQRPPVVMVDTFYGIDERGCARSGLTVTADNLLVADGVLDECGIVEHIAQSGAPRAGFMNPPMGPTGALGVNRAGNDQKVHFLPPVGSRLVTQNMVEQTVMNVTLLSARTECDGKPVAECRMKIYLEE